MSVWNMAWRVPMYGHAFAELYVIVMFYCTEIWKAPNMLSCQCETWRDAFLCMGMPLQNVYAGLHGPFVSHLAETLRWKLSMCIIILLCRGSLALCFKKYGYRLSKSLSWKIVCFFFFFVNSWPKQIEALKVPLLVYHQYCATRIDLLQILIIKPTRCTNFSNFFLE
jgi:uncharacterized membrane protein YoaT (DUF817 family)